ncbi:MAG: hypothetical protein EpisKO_08710 [Epibacterium sp.]
MAINVGTLDRILRAALGLGLLYLALMSDLALFQSAIVRYGAIAVAVVMLVVAMTRVCPLYTIFGLKTCRR